ncbi:MAG: lytic transglycosylase domain-containing protein [Bryobacterales bacterium]|nr:lytic transglycosylase domain-containing protein [Bryobacterales bacterium]
MAVLSQSYLPASERLAPGVTGELRNAVHGPAQAHGNPSQASPAQRSRPPAVTRRVSTVLVDEQTGRLVRVRGRNAPRRSATDEREAIRDARQVARKTPAVEPGEIRELIDRTARKHGVDPKLVHSVVRVESNYEQKAISPKGALGLMQLIPATAKRYGVDNPFDPSQNIDGGVRYLKFLTERFQGDLQLALAAYNAGEGAVDRHGGIPPYRETRAYVTKVTRGLNADNAEGESVALLAAPSKPAMDSLEVAGFTGTGSMQESNVAPSRIAAVRMYTDSEGRLHLETVQ